jgi:hypothetical protein
MWKKRGADTGTASCSIVDKKTAVKTLESFYHLVHRVIHNFAGKDGWALILWKTEAC